MILLDYSQTAIAGIMIQLNNDPRQTIDEGFVRHVVLNTMRSYVKQFKSKYGELVVCCDSKSYWRRDYFPFYKSSRKKARTDSKFDWNLIFTCLNKIRDELKEYFPAKVLEVGQAEADDIIAVLATRHSAHEDVLIISSDKDFLQLQKYERIQQYSPALKRFIRTNEPASFIKQHIISGDRGDGIPNILSPDNTYAIGGRNKSILKEKLEAWIKSDPKDFCINDTMRRNYERNRTLIDLACVPLDIQKQIITTYENTKVKPKMAFLNYMANHKLKALMEVADEF